MQTVTNRSAKTIHVVDDDGRVFVIPANTTMPVPDKIIKKLALSPVVDGVPPEIVGLKDGAEAVDEAEALPPADEGEVVEPTGDEESDEESNDEVESEEPGDEFEDAVDSMDDESAE